MKILFVTQVMLDQPFGGPRHVLAVARELAKLGHRVSLLAPGRDPDSDHLQRVRPPAFLRPGARMEAALAALIFRTVLSERPDVAYVRISASSSLVPFALAALRIPYVLELNGRILDELAELGRGRAAIAVVHAQLAKVVKGAKSLVAVEAKIGRHARDALGAKDVVVIENGADLDAATPGDRGEARRALGLDPAARYVGFTGTLVPEQRLDLLFEARRKLGVALLIAGGGPQLARLEEEKTRAPIVALGAVPHDRAVLAIRASDVCVNVRDGDLGMKCFEYAAIGRRFVTFRVEGAERLEALYPGLEAAHLVDERTSDAYAAAIARALDAEARLGPLPKDAIEAARKTIGWDHTAARISRVLEAACA